MRFLEGWRLPFYSDILSENNIEFTCHFRACELEVIAIAMQEPGEGIRNLQQRGLHMSTRSQETTGHNKMETGHTSPKTILYYPYPP